MSEKRPIDWPQEIEAVYRDQGRELWALFYSQCSDADRAYDALQESFSRLCEHENKGEKIVNHRAWLLQVGRNWLRDVARRQRVAAKPTEHLENIVSEYEEPAGSFVQEELRGQVRTALIELKPKDREVLILRYSLNWSSIRIAEVLETSAAAIDMRLSRARKRLGEILEKAGIRYE